LDHRYAVRGIFSMISLYHLHAPPQNRHPLAAANRIADGQNSASGLQNFLLHSRKFLLLKPHAYNSQ
jgi:hypothetical protein